MGRGQSAMLVMQPTPEMDMSAPQSMTPISNGGKQHNILSAAQLKHSVGLRISSSDPELGELEIIGAGFKDCFPHLQLCDYDSRYTYLWQCLPSETDSPNSSHTQDTTCVTSTTWDDLEIQFTDNPVSDSFLRNIRGKTSPIMYEEDVGSPSSGSATTAATTVFESGHVAMRHLSSPQWESPPGTQTLDERAGGVHTAIPITPPVFNAMNPYAAVYIPALLPVPVEEGAFDDAEEEPELALTPAPDRHQLSPSFQPIAIYGAPSATALTLPPADHSHDIGRQRKWRYGQGPPRGRPFRAAPVVAPSIMPSISTSTAENSSYVSQPSPNPWNGSWK